MTEEWRDIPGYEGLYQINCQSEVRSLPRKRQGRGMYRHLDVGGHLLTVSLKGKAEVPYVMMYNRHGVGRWRNLRQLFELAFPTKEQE